MKNLILKDIEFNIKNILIGLAAAIFFSIIVIDGNEYGKISFFMVPSLLFSFCITKMCYMEDNANVSAFIRILPVKNSNIVLSKYLESFLTLPIAYIIIAFMNVIIHLVSGNRYDLVDPMILSIFGIVFLYDAVYLFLYYCYNYSVAQHTIYVLLLLYLGLFYVQKKDVVPVSIEKVIKTVGFNAIFFMLLFLISMVIGWFCLKRFKRKEY